MLRLNKKYKFAAAIIAQLAIIGLLVIFKWLILNNGVEITLKVLPRDPRDVLRGDYVKLEYNISRLPERLLSKNKAGDFRAGRSIYVLLQRGGDGIWRARSASYSRPQTAEGQALIKGRLRSKSCRPAMPRPTNKEFEVRPELKTKTFCYLRVDYGIEEYYVPEGRGVEINRRGQEMSAKVKVDKAGRAVLERLYVNGHPWP